MGRAALTAPALLIIGAASLDVLHLSNGLTAEAPGGAGLYTALAAQASGAEATLLAPRPQLLPQILQSAAQAIQWIGPTVDPAQTPRLEIAHFGNGRAQLLNAAWGAELTVADLPADLSGFAWIHIAALRSAQRQLDFARACRQHGAARLSVGTYAHVARSETETVRQLITETDAFFMNENEAGILFGSVDEARPRLGGLLFVTRGAQGAVVWEGPTATALPAPVVEELDPTGAGDTFCGATLAHLALGRAPAEAAQRGIALASRQITAIGPSALINPSACP